MAWSGGAFTRIGGSTHWVDDKNAAINIVASRHDTNDEDLATGINFCLNRDNSSRVAADFLPDADNSRALGTLATRWKSFNGLLTTTANAILGLGPVAAAAVDMTPDASTFTGTVTGMTGATTGTFTWYRIGKLATLQITADILGISNAATMTMTGLPADLKPAHAISVPCWNLCDASTSSPGLFGAVTISASGLFTFALATGATPVLRGPFTTSGTKGLFSGWSVTYPLQ